MAQSSMRVDVISGFNFKASKDRRIPVTRISNSLTPRDTKPSTWGALHLDYLQGTAKSIPWKLSLQRFSISGSPKKGKLITQGKTSVKTVQNYVLVGKSKRIPFQKGQKGQRGKKRPENTVNIRDMLNILSGPQQPHCFCILSVLELEGWIKRLCEMLSSL